MTGALEPLRGSDEIEAALPVGPSKAAEFLLYTIAALFFLTLIWAATAKLDRVTRGEGKIVPSNQLQEVQYLEGGIVKEILVKAGDHVARGDILVHVDPTQANADYVQGRDGYHLLAARIERLEAEAGGAEPSFSDMLVAEAPGIVAEERALFAARRAEFESARSIKAAELEDAEAALRYAEEAYNLAGEEMRIVAPLVKKGIEPQIELVRARQRRASALGELQRAKIAVDRARSDLDGIVQTFQASAADELSKARGEMAAFSGELPALRDKMDRTALRAPIDGIVNRVLVTTVGGVVAPGETIVEVVPAGDTPLVKARVKPADIGFLHVGQPARVRLTAYDSSVYGSLDAKIETISPDAIEDEKTGDSYFEILVRTDDVVLRTRRGGVLPLSPGMAAEVDVLNGKRTVLAYILKPIADVKGRALKED